MIEQLQSLMKALEAGSYNAAPQQSEKPVNNLHKGLGRGACKITVTNVETGETILSVEGFLREYHTEMSRSHQPIHVLGRYEVMDHIIPSQTTLTLTATLLPQSAQRQEFSDREAITNYLKRTPGEQPKPEYYKKGCEHQWKKYEGFMENYHYCELCNEKRS